MASCSYQRLLAVGRSHWLRRAAVITSNPAPVYADRTYHDEALTSPDLKTGEIVYFFHRVRLLNLADSSANVYRYVHRS